MTAGRMVAIHNHSDDTRITGGVVIAVKAPATLAEWFADYGLKPVRGVVTLYKAVDNDYESSRGFRYEPGSTPVAGDWDGGKSECGGGLHFCPHPALALGFKRDATRFIACPVKVSDIAFHAGATFPSKVKARAVCKPCWEVDIHGDPIRVEQAVA